MLNTVPARNNYVLKNLTVLQDLRLVQSTSSTGVYTVLVE
jgi:hypothetical protein